jgi:hypothetical protein
MEIKNILDNNIDDMRTFFSKYKIKYRKYSNEKCYIMKNNSEDIVEEWQRHLRGLVYNYEEKKILVLPPIKSHEIDGFISDDIEFTELFDGTMVNIFYNNDKWNISSRSTIGCNNRWIMNKTYKELFEETQNIDYKTLNKHHSYSFVLRNKSNRNISYIENDEIILVKIYDTVNLCDIELNEDLGFRVPKVYKNMDNIDVTDCRIKGFTYVKEGKRYKWLTMPFKIMKELKLNINNKSLMYYELRKNGNLKEYLNYFPEDSEIFSKNRSFFHNLKDKLYDIYYAIHVKKEMIFKDINYEYKPLIKELHQIYLSTGNKIRLKTIEDYLHNLPSKRLVFIMNFSK